MSAKKGLVEQDLATLDVTKLTPLSPEVSACPRTHAAPRLACYRALTASLRLRACRLFLDKQQ